MLGFGLPVYALLHIAPAAVHLRCWQLPGFKRFILVYSENALAILGRHSVQKLDHGLFAGALLGGDFITVHDGLKAQRVRVCRQWTAAMRIDSGAEAEQIRFRMHVANIHFRMPRAEHEAGAD